MQTTSFKGVFQMFPNLLTVNFIHVPHPKSDCWLYPGHSLLSSGGSRMGYLLVLTKSTGKLGQNFLLSPKTRSSNAKPSRIQATHLSTRSPTRHFTTPSTPYPPRSHRPHPIRSRNRGLDRGLHLLLVARIEGTCSRHVDIAQRLGHLLDAGVATRDPANGGPAAMMP